MAATPDDTLRTPPPDAPRWLMPLWLVCFLAVIVFGLISYVGSWWFVPR